MEKKSIHDILPVELIHRILLRVPAKHLARLRCVWKLWYSLISDPHFAEMHFHHSPASTYVFIENDTMAYFVDLDALFRDNNDALQVRKVSLPFKMKSPPRFEVLGSCRGFVLLHQHGRFLVVWNPLTGSSKLISYSHIASRFKPRGWSSFDFDVYGFCYDASHDDYLVFLGWQNEHGRDHFHCFSLRTNSWIDFGDALLKPLGFDNWQSCGLFLNGAFHWVPSRPKDYRDAILIFDLKERTFSTISAPEQLRTSYYSSLTLLGGCLALYYYNDDSYKTDIWVMKEYKVHSSWTLYQIPFRFQPLYLPSAMDLIGKGYDYEWELYIYNFREERLQRRFEHHCFFIDYAAADAVYTESLLPLPSDLKDKDKEENEEEEVTAHTLK
ncbi:hypothetical protein Ahy_A04g017320 [Arachis hypogaea]|uniref:F-box domain-containing protein n=1 Tax=Arachis hypogaea TaxID=3818 RepID=A0A445DAR0_ARAHY|nr:hypothetical protein Ahy_A04g017320 [Arachis hypogaea]